MTLEDGWTEIDRDDPIFEAPSQPVPVQVAPFSVELPTQDLHPEDFERLVRAVAIELEGTRLAYRYGVRGQKQEGIDVIAFMESGAVTAYQVKRMKAFTKSDLDKVVTLFRDNERPFGASRLVIAVACLVEDRKVLDALDAWQQEVDFEIELWDRAILSDRLRPHRGLVARFFGEQTAALISGAGRPDDRPDSARIADAAIRGPLRQLRLDSYFRSAESDVKGDPLGAAEKFGVLASRLEAAGYLPHAREMRRRQASALTAGGDGGSATRLAVQEFWLGINSVGPEWEAVAPLRGLNVDRSAVPEDQLSAYDLAHSALNSVYFTSGDLDVFAAALDRAEGALFVAEAAVCFAEHCAASGRLDLISQRAGRLQNIANTMDPGTTPAEHDRVQQLQLRILMCTADSAEAWAGLARRARTEFSPSLKSWLSARHARWLALNGYGDEAIKRYQDAIESACLNDDFDAAAAWLYALRQCLSWYQPGNIRSDDQHPFAQSLRTHAQPSALPGSPVLNELALRGLWPGSVGPAEAMQRVKQWRWQTFTRADLGYELESHRGLATLLHQDRQVRPAILEAITSTSEDGIKKLVQDVDDKPVELSAGVLTPNPGQRQAAYMAVSLLADLIPDELADDWLTTAIGDLAGSNNQPMTPYVDTWTRALAATASLANALTPEHAQHLLALFQSGQGRLSDPRSDSQERARILTAIATIGGELREQAMKLVLAQMLTDQRFAEAALENIEVFRDSQDLVERTMSPAAQDTSHPNRLFACLAFAAAGLEAAPAVTRYAAEQIATAANYQPPPRGVMTYHAGTGRLIYMSRALPAGEKMKLAEALLRTASEPTEGVQNQRTALRDLARLCQQLDDASRSELFGKLAPFVTGEFQAGPDIFDGWKGRGANPAANSIAREGLRAAAACAVAPADAEWIEQQGLKLLAGADENEATHVARAFALINIDNSSLPLDLFATHPNAGLRAFAAIKLCERDRENDRPIVAVLARDPATTVRSSLAGQIEQHTSQSGAAAVLATDPRRSIRRQIANLPTDRVQETETGV